MVYVYIVCIFYNVKRINISNAIEWILNISKQSKNEIFKIWENM